MKLMSIRFACIAALFSLFAASFPATASAALIRPTATFALYRGEMEPVVGAKGQRPLVLSGEEKVPVDMPATIGVDLGMKFSEGRVEVRNESVDGWMASSQGAIINPDAKTIDFRGDLTADTDLDDVYVVVLVYNVQDDLSQPVRFYGAISEVGRLKAGTSKGYQASMPMITEAGTWDSIVLVYSGGLEIPTNEEGTVIARHLDALDRVSLAEKIEQRNGGPDATLAIERHFPVQLSDELRAAYEDQTVNVRLDVGSDGNVKGVELVGVEDVALAAVLSEQLVEWLFVPSVKDGNAVGQKVVLPLKF